MRKKNVKEPISQELLDILRCPACDDRPKVELQGDKLVCVKCCRAYSIKNGIPTMIVEDAEVSEEAK
jgi:uncharacterized protein YbaR (Trm112 family)